VPHTTVAALAKIADETDTIEKNYAKFVPAARGPILDGEWPWDRGTGEACRAAGPKSRGLSWLETMVRNPS
jgi:hypothetical protein